MRKIQPKDSTKLRVQIHKITTLLLWTSEWYDGLKGKQIAVNLKQTVTMTSSLYAKWMVPTFHT